MLYMVLRGRWCNIIVLNVHSHNKEKNDHSKDRFYKEKSRVFFNHFPKCHMKLLSGNFNKKLGRKIF